MTAMTNQEFRRRLHKLIFTCGQNHRYHHYLERLWGVTDKVIRGLVAMLAIIVTILAVPGADSPPTGLVIAIFAPVVAAILNIVQVGDWEKFHGEMFRLWSDLQSDAEIEEHKLSHLGAVADIPEVFFDRFIDLTNKANNLHLAEPKGWKWLLKKCYEDQMESEYGVRSFAEAQSIVAQKRSPAANPSPSPSLVEGPAAKGQG